MTAGRMTVEEESVMSALVTAWCYSVLSIYLGLRHSNSKAAITNYL